MAAYRRVYDSRHLQAECQEPGSSMGYLYLFTTVPTGSEKSCRMKNQFSGLLWWGAGVVICLE